jgi:hypothetical protein
MVPASIPDDGSEDVTARLNSFIAGVPSGTNANPSIVRFQAGGRYRIEGRVFVKNKNHFVMDGNGATLFAKTPGTGTQNDIANRSHLILRFGSDLTVEGLTIVGANPNPGHFDWNICCQNGITLAGTQGAVITGNTIRNVYGDNVYVTPEDNISPTGIQIVSNSFVGNGRQGLSVVGGSDIQIQQNFIDGPGLSVVDLEPHLGAPISYTHIVANTFANTIGATRKGSAITAASAAPVSHVEILSNTVTWGNLGVTATSPKISRQTDWLIQGNVVTSQDPGHSAYGYLQFTRMDRVTVTSNTVVLPDQHGYTTWVVSDGSNSVHVTNNTVKNANPFLSCVNGSNDCWASGNRS